MSDQSNPRIINELRATAQLMTLEPGVFCVFHQGPVTTDSSGLPGVRISLPPGPGLVSGHVQISTFRDDGWLGGADSAALIRINGDQPSQVLVTVYQAPTGVDAPRLQVVRLSDVPNGKPPAPPPPALAPAAPERPKPSQPQPPADQAEVAVHINRKGDVLAMIGDWAGERGSQRWIEGFALSPKHDLTLADIEYQAVLGRDWLSPWSEGGQYCGSRGMSLPLLGLRVRLRGAAADRFELSLEASFVNGATVGPVAAGEACETSDHAALEAFRLVVTPRTVKPGRPAKPDTVPAPAPVRRRAPAPAPAPAPAEPKKGRRIATAQPVPVPPPAAKRTPAPTPPAPVRPATRGKPAGPRRR